MALPIWGYFRKSLADKSLGITEDMTFQKPENFNINLDCDDDIQKREPSNFNDFF